MNGNDTINIFNKTKKKLMKLEKINNLNLFY